MSEKRAFRILLVEDSATDAEMTCRALQRSRPDCVVEQTGDGSEALAMLGETKSLPDLILLDLNMPNVDGIHVLRRLREDARLSSTPVVVLTTSAARADVIACYALAANAYMVKPFEIDKFYEAIDRLCAFWLEVVEFPH